MTTMRSRPATLADALLPERSMLRDLGLVLGGSLFIALFAQVSLPLPFTPVPLTGQTFAVLLVGMTLGSRLGTAAVLAYLLEGAAGLPVFAPGGGAPGVARFLGPTGGYLLGFVLAAWLAGRLAERGWTRTPGATFAGMLLTGGLILAVGALWLGVWLARGVLPTLTVGFLPFVPGDVVKAGLAALLLPVAWRLVGRR